jgi:hypothetical protein
MDEVDLVDDVDTVGERKDSIRQRLLLQTTAGLPRKHSVRRLADSARLTRLDRLRMNI